MKTEVYSWRVPPDLKTGLEREAKRRKMSLSAVLDRAARGWLEKPDPEIVGEEEQLRLHRSASHCFGAFASGDAHRSQNVRETLRKRLQTHYGR